ncbi:MAG: penicillin-binding protein 2 [Alphaproteobacteria bacterium]|nr:penicillin-binding protein 2 [Alphaproteobacteria bacterium]
MFGKYFSKDKNKIYLPGEEIRIDRSYSFNGGSVCKEDPISVCRGRMFFAIGCFCLFYLVISLKLFNLCLTSAFEKQGNTRKIADIKSPIRRADIVDRNGTIIATSLPVVNLYAHPHQIINPEKAAHELANILPDMNFDDILHKLRSKNNFVYLKRNLTPSQQYQINYLGIPGLNFENGEKRVYPHKNLFAHIIGATDIDNEGISGMEKALNDRLVSSDIPLQLSVDVSIQDTVRMHLLEGMKKYKAQGAMAVLMDVKNSEIISMVSLPDFDPNSNQLKSERSLFNMATKGVYEPGSVLKIFNTAMSLESGKIKVADKFDATEPLRLKHNVIKDYRGENRWLSVPEILVYSSNIGSARMALKVGGSEQRNFLERLGFFDKLDIEVAEKGYPLVPKRWGEGTVATVAYGYGIAVSPLHVISGYSAMINGGIYHSPSFLKDNPKGKGGHRVISYNTSQSMRKLMRLVVTDGSGKRANVKGYEVGGKTGTANKISAQGKYVDKKVRTTFVSAFPISDPKYALIVMMDEPQPLKETWGFVTAGWNSVPTASAIITAIAPQLNLKANYDLDELRRQRIIEASYSH